MDTRRGRFGIGLLVVVLLGALLPVLPAGAEAFADPAFERVWERTDRPIASGEVSRTWTWGPEGFRTVREPYQESPGGSRQVQYFDKSRMEITNPTGDRSSRWFATNGLLVKELISGRMQVGDNAYETRPAAAVPVAGDPAPANPGAPTYANEERWDRSVCHESANETGVLRRDGCYPARAGVGSVQGAAVCPEG